MRILILIVAFAVAALAQQGNPSEIIDSVRLLADLEILSSDDMQGRMTGTAGGEKARRFVIDRFKAAGISPFGSSYEHPFTFRPLAGFFAERRGANVIGHIEGTRYRGRYIVISAHYDHLGTINGRVFNGADDNASGTAALFAIGRYFASRRPANSLIFAAFDAEEGGLYGSRAFVAKSNVDKTRLILNLNLDMIGRAPDDRLFAVGTERQPFLRRYLEPLVHTSSVKLLLGHDGGDSGESWISDSDHYSFIEAGIPALYFGVEDYAQHHRSTDDYETMTHDFYVRAVETLVNVIIRFDEDLDPVEAERLNHR